MSHLVCSSKHIYPLTVWHVFCHVQRCTNTLFFQLFHDFFQFFLHRICTKFQNFPSKQVKEKNNTPRSHLNGFQSTKSLAYMLWMQWPSPLRVPQKKRVKTAWMTLVCVKSTRFWRFQPSFGVKLRYGVELFWRMRSCAALIIKPTWAELME